MRPVLVATGAILFLANPSPAAITSRILDADQVLSEHTRLEGSRRIFMSPDGTEWDLVTATNDPAIQNQGSGSFCPATVTDVQHALDEVASDLGAIDVEILILPFPRRALLTSSADHGVIYLSPGVYPYTPAQVHALVAHELGHIVHQTFLPEGDPRWADYRDLRGLTDSDRFNETVEHRNRPHEIFAEDFRVLFGGPEANYSGTIENQELANPLDVRGLRDFMREISLAGRGRPLPLDPGLVSSPNPFRPETTIHFTVTDGDDVTLDIVNVEGRLVKRLVSGRLPAGDHSVVWNGTDAAGGSVAAGLYFVSITTGASRSVLKLIRSR